MLEVQLSLNVTVVECTRVVIENVGIVSLVTNSLSTILDRSG